MTSSNEIESDGSPSQSVSSTVKKGFSSQGSLSGPKGATKAKGRGNTGRSGSKNRPKKRKLVRWNDDLDKEVLLTVQWACSESGIKVPWGMVAAQIGKDVSEGALIQHLSKLRTHMVNAKIDVPPLLRRGIPAREPSKIYGLAGHKRKAGPFDVTPTPTKGKTKSKAGTRSKNTRNMSDEDDSDEEQDVPPLLSDSEEEYGGRKKKTRASRAKPKFTTSKAQNLNHAKKRTSIIKEECIETDIRDSVEQSEALPARRTRGIKQDFRSVLADDTNFSNDEEAEDEEGKEVKNGESGDEGPVIHEASIGIDNSHLLSRNPAMRFSFTEDNAKTLKKFSQQGLDIASGVQGASWTQQILSQRNHIPNAMFNPSFTFGNGQLSNGVNSYQNLLSNMYDLTPPMCDNGSFSSHSGLSRTASYPTDFETFFNTTTMANQAPNVGPQIHANGFMMNMPGPSYGGESVVVSNDSGGMFSGGTDGDDDVFGGQC